MARKPQSLGAGLRSLTNPVPAPALDVPGMRRHFAKKASDTATPARVKPVPESAIGGSMWKSDMVTLLFQSLKIMPDPDEVLKKAGLTRAMLRKLVFDDEIAEALDTRREAACNVPWRLEVPDAKKKKKDGTSGSEQSNESIDFITAQIKAHEDLLFPGCWNSRAFGYSVVQIVFSNLGDRVGLRWVGEMPFEYYFPQRDGTVLYRPQMQGEPVPILDVKYLVPVVNPTYANPYGDALLSRLYWLWFFRTHGWQYWIQWLEQFGAPLLHGATPNVVVDPVKGTRSVEALAALMDKMRRGSSITTDELTKIQVLQVPGEGKQFAYFDDATTRQIAKVILGQTLTSSEGKHGTQALGLIHNEVRQDKKRADVKILRRCGQLLVNRLHLLNGFPGEPPMFVMEDEKGLQKDRAERDTGMADKGMIVFTRTYLEERYDLEPDDFIAPGEPGFDEARGTPKMDANGQPIGKKKPGAVPVDKKKRMSALLSLFTRDAAQFTPEQDVIEANVEALMNALPDEILTNEDILQAIREASDENDLVNRLAVACQGADLSTFRMVLEKALCAASVIGFVHAAEHAEPSTTASADPPVTTLAPTPAFELHSHFHASDGPRLITKDEATGAWRSDPAPPKTPTEE